MPGTRNPDREPDLRLLADPDGRMDQSFPADALLIPWLLELKGHGLLYAYDSPQALARPQPQLTPSELRDARRMHELGLCLLKAPSRRVLDEFVGLTTAPAEAILAFARRWGVLDLCKHGLPFTHSVEKTKWGIPQSWTCAPFRNPDYRLSYWCHYGYESLWDWWMWARRADAILKIAANLQAGRRGRRQDWDIVADWKGEGLPRPVRRDDIDAEWYLLCRYVNEWCEVSQVSLHISYQPHGIPAIRFGSCWAPGRLFGTIGLQLMTRVSGAGSMAVCSSCSCLFTPSRIPKPLEASYCSGCRGKGVPVRMAKRRLAALKSKARAMRDQGLGISEIARAIRREIPVVRKWVSGSGRPK